MKKYQPDIAVECLIARVKRETKFLIENVCDRFLSDHLKK